MYVCQACQPSFSTDPPSCPPLFCPLLGFVTLGVARVEGSIAPWSRHALSNTPTTAHQQTTAAVAGCYSFISTSVVKLSTLLSSSPSKALCVCVSAMIKPVNQFLMTVLPNPGSCPMPFRVCFVFRHSEPVLCQRIIIYITHHSFAYLTRISHPSWIQVQSIMNRLCTSSKVLILDTSIGL